ncbi:MAG: discoidin domain-containing protein [Tidjanibacter sp.]|nr:discoidin domain-containing protein [Tidjanibacter sp.]
MNMDNPNVALGKRVLEECNTPEAMLDGSYKKFDGTKGYCGVHVPAYLTIDLGKNYEIGYIRFLLMNPGKNENNHNSKPREYFYRILVSEDTPYINGSTKWSVLYDSLGNGYVNWQCFTLSEPMQIRYIRIHAIDNRKNNGFHIVQFEAYNRPTELYEGETASLDVTIDTANVMCEIGDGMPLFKKLNDISGLISTIMRDELGRSYLQMNVPESSMPLMSKSVLNAMTYDEVTKTYNVQGDDMERIITNFANDIKVLERNSDGIERAVISPVQAEMVESRRRNAPWTVWGFVSGIISVALAIMAWLNG